MESTNDFETYKTNELCEALGEDGKWYFATIEAINKDGTYCCELSDYPVRWISVASHNLRKRARSAKRVRIQTEEKSKKLEKQETFTEFDEWDDNRKNAMKAQIQLDKSETFSEFDEIIAPDAPQLGKIPSYQMDEENTGCRIHLPSSPNIPLCFSPFGFMLSERLSPSTVPRPSEKRNLSPELLWDYNCRITNLYSDEKEKNNWTKEEKEQHAKELEAEINRLQNEAQAREEARSLAAYVSITSSRFLSAGEAPSEFSESHRTKKLSDAFFEGEMDFSKRVILSNHWDNDPTNIQAKWKPGSEVEAFFAGQWHPATVETCNAEGIVAWVTVQLDGYATSCKFQRFGTDLRPRGYIQPEPQTDNENQDEDVLVFSL